MAHSVFRRRKSTGLTVRALQTGEAEILIYDEISPFFGVSARDVVQELRGISADTIHLRLNSPGGDVFDGLAIYNALRQHPARVVSHIDGLAASIASVIALAGDDVEIADNAFMMIHQPFALTIGNAADHRNRAETLDKVGDSIIGIYAGHSDQPRAQVVQWMDEERWFTASEALEAGFVDVVVEEAPAIAAAFDLSVYTHVPDAIRGQEARQKQDFEDALREAGLSRRDSKIAARVARQTPIQREAGAQREAVDGVTDDDLRMLVAKV